ncbi:hypothetical protein [Streptomyces solaniscabiei]|uniref:hypothetical protein n=1 Tax=Streptomyces solaniscabiei TaxID=2683255 RepID=UPI001CE3823C|nr:hypothetical protein [Streptomyces solaniscabiei]
MSAGIATSTTSPCTPWPVRSANDRPTGRGPAAGALTAIARSAVFVDVNPLGNTCGLLLSSAAPEHRARLFQQLMPYGLSAIVAGPARAWSLFGWVL